MRGVRGITLGLIDLEPCIGPSRTGFVGLSLSIGPMGLRPFIIYIYMSFVLGFLIILW